MRVGLLLILGFALLWALRKSLSADGAVLGFAFLGLVYVALEVFWQQGDLLILPVARTILQTPERVANWFTDPLRWAVVGELFVAMMLALTVWLRFRGPSNQSSPGGGPELSPA